MEFLCLQVWLVGYYLHLVVPLVINNGFMRLETAHYTTTHIPRPSPLYHPVSSTGQAYGAGSTRAREIIDER
jgi:hypothetical protein